MSCGRNVVVRLIVTVVDDVTYPVYPVILLTCECKSVFNGVVIHPH